MFCGVERRKNAREVWEGLRDIINPPRKGQRGHVKVGGWFGRYRY
jgi:hypothetical protein